ncbi:hypothetical protein DERF_008018 [Dermatophagoides farinae]|uniref:Uncharacterized protein n=1 Tax=Dermatophagoides farinae TaxID=6954 RepID=A0A922I4Q9_DERFA|nr:hypothetical protein DERF_008018 [Dermatophagoides farinae]
MLRSSEPQNPVNSQSNESIVFFPKKKKFIDGNQLLSSSSSSPIKYGFPEHVVYISCCLRFKHHPSENG